MNQELRYLGFFLAYILAGCEPSAQPPEVINQPSPEPKSAAERPLRIPSVIEELDDEQPSRSIDLNSIKIPNPLRKALQETIPSDSIEYISLYRHFHRAGLHRHYSVQIELTQDSDHSLFEEVIKKTGDVVGVPGPSGWFKTETHRWKVFPNDPTTGPKLHWARVPKSTTEVSRCFRPPHRAAPERVAAVLGRTARKTSTRRIVESSFTKTRSLETTAVIFWYKNGFAQDEHIAQVATSLKQQKWDKSHGESVRQVWQNAQGEQVDWHPVRTLNDIGCELRGPLIKVNVSKEH